MPDTLCCGLLCVVGCCVLWAALCLQASPCSRRLRVSLCALLTCDALCQKELGLCAKLQTLQGECSVDWRGVLGGL